MNLDELEKLAELRKKGIITKKDFDIMSAKLLCAEDPETEQEIQNKLNSFATYELLSGIFWIVTALFQIIFGAFYFEKWYIVLIGVWNIFASCGSFSLVSRIKNRDPQVPRFYEGIVGLIIVLIINLVFGAIIGVVAVVMEFVVRSKILANREIFERNPEVQNQEFVEEHTCSLKTKKQNTKVKQKKTTKNNQRGKK